MAHVKCFIFVRTIQNLWRIGKKGIGQRSGVEHGGRSVLVVFRKRVFSSNGIRSSLFQLPLRHTFDNLRHLSTFVCKSLLTYMPSRIDLFQSSNPEHGRRTMNQLKRERMSQLPNALPSLDLFYRLM